MSRTGDILKGLDDITFRSRPWIKTDIVISEDGWTKSDNSVLTVIHLKNDSRIWIFKRRTNQRIVTTVLTPDERHLRELQISPQNEAISSVVRLHLSDRVWVGKAAEVI